MDVNATFFKHLDACVAVHDTAIGFHLECFNISSL